MLELSEEPKRLISTFLSYRNDIDIYTEDEEKDKEFYKVLFSRLIKNDIKINDITPLGNKETVKKRCENEPDNGRKKIFIIDGDVSIIHGKDIPCIKNLFVLDAYCIENFLFDQESLVHFIYLNCATKSKEVITKEVDFQNWLGEYSELLIELFIHFALANYYNIYYTLFNANKYHNKTKESITFSPELVLSDIKKIKDEILLKIDVDSFNLEYQLLRERWTNCLDNFFTVVSGKDYLIPILLIKTQCFKKSKALPTIEEVKIALAQYCKLDRLDKLKSTIETL